MNVIVATDKALCEHFLRYNCIHPSTKKPVYRRRDPEKVSLEQVRLLIAICSVNSTTSSHVPLKFSTLIRMGVWVLCAKDSDTDDSAYPCGLRPRKWKSGIRKARYGSPKPTFWQQRASRNPRVSTIDISKPLTRVAALARFVAAAVRYGKSGHTHDSVNKVVQVTPSPATEKEVTDTALGQIYRDIDDAWLSGIAHRRLGAVLQVIGESIFLIDPRTGYG